MKSSPSSNSRRLRAFTLIELLIVISIIAILASISVPVTKNVMNKARSASAQNDCLQIQNAIKGYYNEYYHYPVSGNSEGPYATDGSIMDVLMSNNTPEAESLNRRKLPFFEPSKLAKTEKLPGYHADSGRLNDPWGEKYEIYMDADDDEELTIPALYGKKFGRSGRIKKTIFIHSSGGDKKMDESKDNVTSWD
ncbi:MAG: type II secretion system protein [Verrucomicrobiales bacterium]